MAATPTIPESAPFTSEQRAWINGYLAGLFSLEDAGGTVGAELRAPTTATVPLLILFGSQTGTAEGLAKRIAKQANARGFAARAVNAAAHATIDWKKESRLLVVTSTYGDGDMPDNAQEFWEWLQSDSAGVLAHLSFSVLALGDTNYAEFCAAGKKIDARLEQLAARRIHPRIDCNLDYEEAATQWTESVLQKAGPASCLPCAPAPETGSATRETFPPTSAAGADKAPALPYSRNNPFPARLIANRILNAAGSGKETRHFAFSLEGSGLSYEAGDALGVFPSNCPALVDEILTALGCDGEEAVAAPGGEELPLRKVLHGSYDIAKPTPDLLKRVGEKNAVLRELLAPERRDELKKWLWGRGVIDLLAETPDARFSPAEFVALLKKLNPRLYSISSSPKAHAGEVHLTVSVVRYEAYGRVRKGVCSTFLADRVGELTAPVFAQPSHGFKLPSNGDAPIIMVGPGTGIAPFRAFLHERRVIGAKGRNWLFFGEQRAATDFYYREELESMLADGHLTKLSSAFSRDQTEKIYVQRRMMEHAADLWAWLQDGAHFYVCGDASRMAKDVDAALHKIVETAGGLGVEGAMDFVKKLKTDKRYQRDVY